MTFTKRSPDYQQHIATERRGGGLDTPASHSEGPGFKFRPCDLLSWLWFLV